MNDHQNPEPRSIPPVPPDSRSKNRSRYILVNTLSSYGRDVVDTITFLVLIPFIIKTLGTDAFGLWSLIWSFLAFFELADMGFGASVVKYVADARGRQDMARQQAIVCTLFWIYVALGIIVMGGVAVSLLFFNRVFDIPVAQAASARWVLMIIGVRSALYMPLGMFRGVLVGHQKMKVTNGYKVLGSIAYFVSVLLVLTHIPDLRVLAGLNALMGVLPMFAMLVHVTITLPDLSLHPRHFDRSLVRELSSFSVYFSLIQIAGLIATRVDAIVIKLFMPLQMVAVYAIGMRLSTKAEQFCYHLIKALTPVVAELHGGNDQQNIRAVWYRGSKLTIACSTPLLLGLALLAEPLIIMWTSPEFTLSVPVCQWLTAAVMIAVIHGNTENVLSMGGEQRFLAFSTLGCQALNLGLSLLLIHVYGITGVAMATFLAYVPIYAGLIQTRAGRIHGQSHWVFYRATLIPSAVPALLMAAFLLGVQRFWPLTNLAEVAILELLGTLLFGAAFWIIGFNAKERGYFKEKIFSHAFRRRYRAEGDRT
ncbi:MAG: oligosaccharide flippase family protein [Deltaproteobacteria bacterium]|nr:oligosaccharide flippase family protein [Deltaproteobacteria bacterium]